jgi:hypothetical protein
MRAFLLFLTLLPGHVAAKAPFISLPGYWLCQGSSINGGKASLSCYASKQSDCLKGKVILAYEQLVSKPTEKTRYTIVDTVQVTPAAATLTIATCTSSTGKPTQYFVLIGRGTSGGKYLSPIKRAWGVSAKGRLVELPTKKLKCLNDGFGA